MSQNVQLIKRMTDELISQIQKDIQNALIKVKDKPVTLSLNTHKNGKSNGVPNISAKKMHKDHEHFEDLSPSRSKQDHEKIQKVKQILKKQKEFTQQLKKKQKQFADYIAEKQKQDQQLKTQLLLQKCEERKIELKKQREELQKKKQERKITFQLEIKKLKQIKAKKLLHQTMQEKFQQQNDVLMNQKEKAYQLQKQRRKNVTIGIEQHQKHYLQLKKQRQLQRQSSLTKSKLELPTIKSKIWLKLQKSEEEQLKIKQWQLNVKDEHLNKRRTYSKQVKQLFSPKLKLSNNFTVRQEIAEARKGLDFQGQFKLGNEYMKSVHQSITQQQVQKMKNSLEKVDVFGGHSAFYKNYLADIKSQNKRDQIKLTSEAFEQTAENQNLSQQQRLLKLKKMLKMKQRKMQKGNDLAMIDSIKSKLLVLKEMVRR